MLRQFCSSSVAMAGRIATLLLLLSVGQVFAGGNAVAGSHVTASSVLVTIRPLAWLVSAIAPPGTEVQVLLDSGQSPHDFQLRPLDVARIERSALLVSVGPGMEPWLQHLGSQLSPARHLQLLPGSVDHHHDDEAAGEEDHDHDAMVDVLRQDPHIWLDPLQMDAAAMVLAQRLQQWQPQQADVIAARQARFHQQMLALDAELAAMLAPVQQRGFMVYHDGYGRLVKRYRLNQLGAVWHHEAVPVGARERAAILRRLNSGDVACLFYEPQFGADAVAGWLGSAAGKVRLVELDPLGGRVPAGDAVRGEEVYPLFVRGLVAAMAGCLRG